MSSVVVMIFLQKQKTRPLQGTGTSSRGATLFRGAHTRSASCQARSPCQPNLAADSMPWALVTAPSPAKPTPARAGSVGGSQVHSPLSQAPALTLARLSAAPPEGLLLLITACNVSIADGLEGVSRRSLRYTRDIISPAKRVMRSSVSTGSGLRKSNIKWVTPTSA